MAVMTDAEIISYIREAAIARGIDPNIAVRVARSEGMNKAASGANKAGDANTSFGPFQLHYGGLAKGPFGKFGVGDNFTKETGLNARDPNTFKQQIDFALNTAAVSGWGQWYGSKRVGIKPRQGLTGAHPVPLVNVGAAGKQTPAVNGPTAKGKQMPLGMAKVNGVAVKGRISQGSAVKMWQSFLKSQGLLQDSPIDGYFGKKTDAATRAFQASQGIPEDGIVGPKTHDMAGRPIGAMTDMHAPAGAPAVASPSPIDVAMAGIPANKGLPPGAQIPPSALGLQSGQPAAPNRINNSIPSLAQTFAAHANVYRPPPTPQPSSLATAAVARAPASQGAVTDNRGFANSEPVSTQQLSHSSPATNYAAAAQQQLNHNGGSNSYTSVPNSQPASHTSPAYAGGAASYVSQPSQLGGYNRTSVGSSSLF